MVKLSIFKTITLKTIFKHELGFQISWLDSAICFTVLLTIEATGWSEI